MVDKIGYCAVFAAVIGLVGCTSPRVTLQVTHTKEGNALFKLRTKGHNSYIYSMVFWDNPNCEFIWSLKTTGRPFVKSFEVEYGGTSTKGMYQQFPKGEAQPRAVKADEIIVVCVDVNYDFGEATSKVTSYAFRISDDGRWIPLKNHRVRLPDACEPDD